MIEIDLDKVGKIKPKKRKKRAPTASQMGRNSWKAKMADPNFDRVAYLRELSKRGNKAQAERRRAADREVGEN